MTATGLPPDCCPGETCHGDPHGMHTMDCAGEVLAQWDAWHCERCGRRYRQPFDPHGAPLCIGVLEPVTVTITRRTP